MADERFDSPERLDTRALLSVVFNTRNRASTLGAAIDSVRRSARESGHPVDLVVIDQSDEFESKEVCRTRSVRYFRDEGRGLGRSRNLGVAHAESPWIAFIDDDAIARPDWIAALHDAIQQSDRDPSIAAIAGVVFDGNTGAIQFSNGAVRDDGEHIPIRSESAGVKDGRWVRVGMGTNMAFSRTWILRVGGFDPFYRFFHDETDLFLRLARAGGFTLHAPRVVVDHFMAPSERRRALFDMDHGTILRSRLYFKWTHYEERGPALWQDLATAIFGRAAPYRVTFRLLVKGHLSRDLWFSQQLGITRGLTSCFCEIVTNWHTGKRTDARRVPPVTTSAHRATYYEGRE